LEDRKGKVIRKTKETEIEVSINVDGTGISNIDSGIGFFNHMLTLLCKHSQIDMDINANGDIDVDGHHTIEDIGIALGEAFKIALGNKERIKRYGESYLPMDETLGQVIIDISGRPFLVFQGEFTTDRLGEFDTELTEEFFRAFAFNSGITIHSRIIYGKNNHHMIEALFKALGRALREAVAIDNSIQGVMSTKGVL
jgi:imidazoleglycerol-phosphate dehydratase